MKRLSLTCLLLGMLAVFAVPVWAATSTKPSSTTASAPANDKSPAAPIAGAISTVTGIAISPLLGTGAYGAYQYFSTEKEARADLPWYAQVSFWLPALAIVGLVAAKDTLGAVLPPGWKKPLDVLETVENKATGLVAAGAVVPLTMAGLSKMIAANPAPTDALIATGTASIHVAAIDWSWLLNILTVPIGVAVFAVVWMASHAINALILLSPWGAIDAALKAARTGLLGLITLTAMLNPWISAALSIVVILVAYLVAGWAFRLTIFGAVFSWDFFTFRRHRTKVKPDANRLFTGGEMTRVGVPMRTYGRLETTAEPARATFVYRPWLVLPEKRAEVNLTGLHVGRGFFFSSVRGESGTAFILPPRYRGHEQALAETYRLADGVRDAGLLKAWSGLRELFGGGAAKTQVG